ncbi:MAG: DNA mismatch repair endonuclease MutL [Chloroflexi bacterium]|nr:DNA mismatch repair endonuclease MutL [Chloroflexota bacterium]
MTIRVLPAGVAARIAAGEVIERPASVVKELIENSLDAGARVIGVETRHGGLASIRVTDDGCGIPENEVPLAFERHATSKLAAVEDLTNIGTLGFRGEALASIAAAASVRLTTRTAAAESATTVELEGGQVVRQSAAGAGPGTTIEVEALFSTIPARLKFIRSASAETARVRQTVDHLAMAHPHVQFTLKTDGRVQLATSGNGSQRDAVAAVHGAELAQAMIEVGSWTGAYPVWGLVGTPEQNRANRTGISLFVNSRWVQHRAVGVAVEEAYRGLLMEGRFPIAVVFLDVPPGEVDVNVHPNKREVRLSHEGDAFSSVQRAVREALLAASPIAEGEGLLSQSAPAAPPLAPSFEMTFASLEREQAPLPEPAPVAPEADAHAGLALPPGASPLSRLRVLGQVANTYIVADGPDGMYLIDQHSAHESVLYYRLLRQWANSAPEVQPMLEPLPMSLTPQQMDALGEGRAVLERFGLLVEPFGDDTLLVRAVPVMARRVDAAKLVAEALDDFAAKGRGADTHLSAAASIACHSAVRAGQTLELQEMTALGEALASELTPQHCPHGRPTVIRVSKDVLGRQFGRL